MDYSEIYPQKVDALSTMELALTGLGNRTKALTNNIANVNTPGYQKQKVEFESELKKLIRNPEENSRLSDIPLERTHNKHLSNSVYEITDLVSNISSQSDARFGSGNGINIDQEMTELAKTGMRYKGVANMTKRYFDHMRSIVRGG
ncbi:MAG: flagellar basal body rod protein FlgB [Cyanobacteriota bacterium]|jgi:flagellar basal-body rod protein FlgB